MPRLSPEKLRHFRQLRVLTQEQLAEKAGLRSATITDLEGGKHQARPSTVLKLAAALEVDPGQLFGGSLD